MTYRLLIRDGCELCEDAAIALRLDGRIDFTMDDVDSRPEWRRRYGDRIPVLLDAQGLLVLAAPIDVERLAALWTAEPSGILRGAGPSAGNATDA
jgi:hypothetical protein